MSIKKKTFTILIVFVFTFSNLFYFSQFTGIDRYVEASSWYDVNWSYRKLITIDDAQVSGSGDLTNFPVLINLASDSDLASYLQVDGDDLLFTSADGTTKLDHEIESYINGTGALVAWVEVPTLSGSVDTEIYMYYGYAGASNQQNVAATWNSNFAFVYHMKEDPSGSAPQLQDSTTNSIDGTSSGSMTSGDVVTGKIGNSIDFDGTDDVFNIYSATLASQFNASTGTLSLWTQMQTATWTDGSNRSVAHIGADVNNRVFIQKTAANAYNSSMVRGSNSENYPYISTRSDFFISHISWDSAGDIIRYYIDGAQVSTDTTIGTYTGTVASNRAYIGAHGIANLPYKGLVDEVRLSKVTLSADWITTEYNNQGSPATFYALGTHETNGSVSVAVVDGTITYGSIPFGQSEDTTASGLNDSQTASNDGSLVEDINIRGQNTACWTLGSSPGSDVYVHEFSINDGADWTPLTTSYQTLASSVSPTGTQDFDLRITVPTTSSCGDQQNVNITLQAS